MVGSLEAAKRCNAQQTTTVSRNGSRPLYASYCNGNEEALNVLRAQSFSLLKRQAIGLAGGELGSDVTLSVRLFASEKSASVQPEGMLRIKAEGVVGVRGWWRL